MVDVTSSLKRSLAAEIEKQPSLTTEKRIQLWMINNRLKTSNEHQKNTMVKKSTDDII